MNTFKNGEGNLNLQFIMQSMQDLELTRLLGCKKVRLPRLWGWITGKSEVLSWDWKWRGEKNIEYGWAMFQPYAQDLRPRLVRTVGCPTVLLFGLFLSHFSDSATKRQECNLLPWTKREKNQRGPQGQSSSVPLNSEMKITLVTHEKYQFGTLF